MPDDGLEPVDITGRWVGFYRQRREQLDTFPIVAEIEQTGNSITGEMYDQITERSDDFVEFVKLIDKSITNESRRRLEAMISHFGPASVRNSRLPDTSDLEGTVRGTQVEFTKVYRGAWEVTWTVEGNPVASARREGHTVRYSGQLDPDGVCIAGKWTISQRGLFGWFLPPEAWGFFELYRKS